MTKNAAPFTVNANTVSSTAIKLGYSLAAARAVSRSREDLRAMLADADRAYRKNSLCMGGRGDASKLVAAGIIERREVRGVPLVCLTTAGVVVAGRL